MRKSGKARSAGPKRAVISGSQKNTTAHTIYSAERARSVINSVVQVTFPKLCDSSGAEVYPQAVNNLGRWFERMEEGSIEDDRTPLFKRSSRTEVVAQFNSICNRNSAKVLWCNKYDSSYAEAWMEIEKGERDDIGPMSIFLPYTLDGPDKLKAVMSDKPPLPKLNVNALEKAEEWMSTLLPRNSVHRAHLQEAFTGLGGDPKSALDTKTNSCFPTYKHEWWDLHKDTGDPERNSYNAYVESYIVDTARRWYNEAARAPYDQIIPRIIGTVSQRTTQKGPQPLKPKNGKLKSKRLVIAVEKPETVSGKTIMAPLQVLLSEVRNPTSGVRLIPAWQPQPILDKNMQAFLQYAEAHGRTVVSGDISSFDATLPPWLMWRVALAISKWMDKETATLFLAIMHADIYRMGVLAPDGYTQPTPSSVKSGSIFTSLIGCMANAFIQMYGHYAGYYNVEQLCVMGDDFIVDGPGLSPESISLPFADFGMECNPSKQFYRRRMLHFLRRLHVLGAPGGQASVYRVLGSVLSVEDDTQLKYDERNKYAYAFQALARLENANMNPEFEELVQYCAKGDHELHLGKDMPPDAITKGAGEYASRRLEYARLKPWETTGSGVSFDRWAVNGVLRGKKLPPPSVSRYEAVYGMSYSTVNL